MIYLAGFKHFSLLQLGMLEGIFHLTSFLMEVPTGAVADIWGKRISRIAGRYLFILSLIILFFADSFLVQALGFVLCALNYNLESGSGDALVYDSVLLLKEEKHYMSIKGKKEFLYQLSSILAFLLGGYLAVRSYPLVFLVTALFSILSLANAYFFTEPVFEKQKEEGHARPGKEAFRFSTIITSIVKQTADSLGIIIKRPRIAFLIIFSELIFTFTTSMYFYLQNYWKSGGRTEWYMGIVFALQAALSGISSVISPGIEKKAGERNILIYLPALLLVCLGGIALTPCESFFYIMTGFLEGILLVAISDYINRMIPSENRATILSFQSMSFSFFMIILFPLMGFLGDTYSLKLTFLAIFLTALLVYMLYTLRFVRQLRTKESSPT